MRKPIEELAIIEDIHIGMRDVYDCICWFTVKTVNGAALQIITVQEICKEIKKHSIYKLEDLNGKPCIVTRDGNLIKFKNLHF